MTKMQQTRNIPTSYAIPGPDRHFHLLIVPLTVLDKISDEMSMRALIFFLLFCGKCDEPRWGQLISQLIGHNGPWLREFEGFRG